MLHSLHKVLKSLKYLYEISETVHNLWEKFDVRIGEKIGKLVEKDINKFVE